MFTQVKKIFLFSGYPYLADESFIGLVESSTEYICHFIIQFTMDH